MMIYQRRDGLTDFSFSDKRGILYPYTPDPSNTGDTRMLREEDNLESAYAIFVSDFFHTQSVQINLLAIPNANTNDSAHLTLILNLPLMLKTLKNFGNEKSTKKIHFCKRIVLVYMFYHCTKTIA